MSTRWPTTEASTEVTGWLGRESAPARPRAAARVPKPSVLLARVLGWLAALGMVVTLALAVPLEKASVLAAPGGLFTAIGRFTGLGGAYLMLVTLMLVARIPAVEAALGQDKLVKLHRRLGPWVLMLVISHVWFITLGYAQQLKAGALHELASMVTSFPGMLPAAVGLGLLLMVGITSYRYARAKLRYETWWAVHLYTYLAIALSLPHQFLTGAPFVGHPAAQAWWIAVWVMTAGMVLWYRVGLPAVRTARHRLTVESIEEEAPKVVSVVMRGRHLDRLPVSGGQYLQWRFLRRGLWWQAHPYSLSGLPTANRLRITVKQLGDHSEALAGLSPGTRVAIEGPYGAFTHHARRHDKVLLVAAGVGVTPVRAMLDDLPWHVDVVAILRGPSARELVLREEVAHLVGERGGRLHEVVGPRSQAPLDATTLRRLVPDIAARDLFVCGPGGFMNALIGEARALGVPDRQIHHEDFSF